MRAKCALLAMLLVVGCRSPAKDGAVRPAAKDATPDAGAAAVTVKPIPSVPTDWCVEGWTAIDEETCYLPPPEGAERPYRLLVYLHGIIPPSPANPPQKENVMTAVRSASQRAGAAALVPRGIRGVGPAGSKDWWAWPTSPGAHAEHAPKIVARIAAAKKRVEESLGAPFARTYLAGSSNGAYFAVNLALRREIEIDGLGAMSGGAPLSGHPPSSPGPHLYVGFGKYDEPSKRGGLALGKAAEQAGWRTKIAEHPFPHGAREVYIDEAFAFWAGLP